MTSNQESASTATPDKVTAFRNAMLVADAQVILADLIGSPAPAPVWLTLRALNDQQFLYYLISTNDIPSLRSKLLGEDASSGSSATWPSRLRPVSAAESPQIRHKHNYSVAKKAFTSLVEWGRTGFRVVDEALRLKRLAACNQCVYLRDPPPSAVYGGLKLIFGSKEKMCSACGCLVSKKVVMAHEKCPVQDPVNPAFSMWNEPWAT